MSDKNIFIVDSKIRKPPYPDGIINRERLFNRLDGTADTGICILTGPAGFGKTSLAASWLQKRSLHAAWYSLDEYDNDITVFFSHILSSINSEYGIRLSGLDVLLDSSRGRQQTLDSSEAAAAFLSELEKMMLNIRIILDDYHLISSSAIHNAVSFLMGHLPANLSLLVLSRAGMPFPVSRLKLAGRISEISAEDIAFDEEETLLSLRAASGRRISPATAEKVFRMTGGWGIAVGLAGLSLRESDSEPLLSTAETGNRISGFLFEEVISVFDADRVTLMCCAAVPDTVQAEMLDYICAEEAAEFKSAPVSAEVFLRELVKKQYFITCIDESSEIFRYHEFFREFLLKHLEKTRPGLRRTLETCISDWYSEQDLPVEALEYAFRADSSDRIISLFERVVKRYSDSRVLFRFDKWQKKMEITASGRIPELELHLAGIHLRRGEIPQTVEHLAGAETLVKDSGTENNRLRARIIAMKTVLVMYRGRHSEAEALCRQGLMLVRGSAARLESMFLTYLGINSLYSGDMDIKETAAVLDEAKTAGERAGDWVLSYSADFQRALFLTAAGSLQMALTMHQTRILDIEKRGLPLNGILGNSYSETAYLNSETGSETDCIGLADRGLEIAEDSCSTESIWWSMFTRLRVMIYEGGTDQTAEAFSRLFSFEKTKTILPWFRDLSQALYIDFLLDQREFEQVRSYFAGRLPDTAVSIRYMDEPILMTYSRYLLLTGNKTAAAGLITKLNEFALSAGKLDSLLKLKILSGEYDASEELAGRTGFKKMLSLYNRDRTEQSKDRGSGGIAVDYAYREELSQRELEVVGLLSKGFSNLQISESLFVSMNTVKTHLKNIYGKLGASNRTQAVHIIRELGLY